MKRWKRILPILLAVAILCSLVWYLFIYDKDFTKDFLLSQARYFEQQSNHRIASWIYDIAYRQSGSPAEIAIEMAQMYKSHGNYSKAEYTLSNAIAEEGSLPLYLALCNTYVEQNKLLDAVSMLDNASDEIKSQLKDLRPSAPTSTHASGFYNQTVKISLSSSAGTLYVSTDGEYPSIPEDLYTGELSLPLGETVLYAVSVAENGLVSPLSIFGYTLGGVVEPITLADTQLDAQVRQLLGKDATAQLLTSDLWTITSLTVPQSVTDYSVLQYFPSLTSLTIENASFSSLQVLSGLTGLETLTITGSTVSSQDLSVIGNLPKLKNLTLSNCAITNLQGLSNAHQLTHLNLSSNTIRDASALSFMSELKVLDLSHNAISNLSYLSALTGLQELNVSYNLLTSVVPLSGCTSLVKLDISHNSIEDLTGLEALAHLTTLESSHNELKDIQALSSITSLAELILAHNKLSDISCLSSLSGLTYFDFSHNQIPALPQFTEDSSLVVINGANNQLSDISGLKVCNALNNVIMDNNKITSVDALAECHNLIQVDITNNPVKNVRKLTDQSIIVNYTP